MALQSLDIERRSATRTASPSVRQPHAVYKLIDVTRCIGCKACQVACMEWNDLRDVIGHQVGKYENPPDLSEYSWTLMRYAEVEVDGRFQWLIRKDGCMHCSDPGCLKACPAPGAIIQYTNGIVDFHQENCIGCGYCIAGCPFNIPRLSKKDGKVYKCSLCSDRVAVGLEPACVKTCPTGALMFGEQEDLLHLAEGRIARLKERGFANAGLYDAPGVNGTHVMYILHHLDKPELYSNLPKDPHISVQVNFWKTLLQPLGMLGFGAAMLVWLGHYLKSGPEVAEEEEITDSPSAADNVVQNNSVSSLLTEEKRP
ncbi:MAG: formate dehydrogenase subunit beta [Beggiatoa sp. IS2]|nr:MAG: formate dehydrogenase subunit beta [Beggiatoa sp. IS2]